MVLRYKLTDQTYGLIQDLLPQNGKRGQFIESSAGMKAQSATLSADDPPTCQHREVKGVRRPPL